MKSGIYAIKNIVNNKLYVGSSKNVDKRWLEHKNMLNNGKHKNRHLNYAWHKYGENNFQFLVIEYVELCNLIKREQYYINYYNVCDKNIGYNIHQKAGSTLGWKPSEETKMKMSISAKKKPPISEETKKKLSIARMGNKNACRIMDDAEKERRSKSLLGINQGEKNGMAITDKNEIIAMRNDYDNGMSISKIMIKYNKKNSFTYQIVKRLRWAWLDNSSLSN